MATRRRAVGEGSIYFDKSKDRWVGSLVTPDGRRKVLGTTKNEARTRLDKLRRDVEAGEQVGDGNATVADALDRWQTRVLAGRDIAPATRDVYVWCAAMLRAEIGSKRLRSLTVDDVEAALDRLASKKRKGGRPLGRSALVKVRSVLGQVLDHAERRGMVNRNVARAAELTPTAKRTERRTALGPADARTLRTQLAGDRLGAMFLVMLTVGLRPGEAAGMMWNDVDLDAATLTVRHAVRLERGRPVVTDELKTKASRRTLSLPAATVDALRAHKAAQTAERLAAPSWPEVGLVFTTRHGTTLSAPNMRRDLARLCAEAGVPVVSPNELRHSAASILSDAGVPLEQIADVLGHATTRMLEQTYRHRVRPSVTAAVEAMDELLG